MVNRTLSALDLPQSPLVFVLGEVRFDPVFAVKSYVDAIQENLRKQGFPKVRTRELTSQFTPGPNNILKAETKTQWEFADVANHTSILLDQDSVSVQTTDYDTFEKFEDLLRLALSATCGLLEVAQINRTGLRYIDAIDPEGDGKFESLIHPSLLGLSSENVPWERNGSRSHTELQTGEATRMHLRCSTMKQGVVLPPEMLPCHLAFKANPNRQSPFALLDLDHFSQTSFNYQIDHTIIHLGELHDALDQVFRKAVTPHALDLWKQLLETTS